MPSAIT